MSGRNHETDPEGIPESPQPLAGIKHLLIVSLALSLLVGGTSQFVSCAVSQAEIGLYVGKADECAEAKVSCTDQMPTCIGNAGCLMLTALPAPPASIALVFAWTSLEFESATGALAGISMRPELSPPILLA